MKRVILASRSPRRRSLLTAHGIDFDVCVSRVDERKIEEGIDDPKKLVLTLSLAKAKDVFLNNPDSIVIGADTTVVFEGEIYGKPEDEEDAKRMLSNLSGNMHTVYTGVCIITKDEIINYCESSSVYFKRLTEKEIDDYIKTGEPMDKAGAYGIQDIGRRLVLKTEGDFENIVGLPKSASEKIKELIEKRG